MEHHHGRELALPGGNGDDGGDGMGGDAVLLGHVDKDGLGSGKRLQSVQPHKDGGKLSPGQGLVFHHITVLISLHQSSAVNVLHAAVGVQNSLGLPPGDVSILGQLGNAVGLRPGGGVSVPLLTLLLSGSGTALSVVEGLENAGGGQHHLRLKTQVGAGHQALVLHIVHRLGIPGAGGPGPIGGGPAFRQVGGQSRRGYGEGHGSGQSQGEKLFVLHVRSPFLCWF